MAEEKDSLIVGPEQGSINLEGDPKAKWYVRAITGGPQQFGLIVLFVLVIITVWYFRTYGLRGLVAGGPHLWDKIDVQQSSAPAQPLVITVTHEWSQTVYRAKTERTVIATDPISAVIEARNPQYPNLAPVRLDRSATLPSNWTDLQFRLVSDDRSISIRVTISH